MAAKWLTPALTGAEQRALRALFSVKWSGWLGLNFKRIRSILVVANCAAQKAVFD
ncbi:MAG: hypothetical protein Q7J76_07805 [Candidatus Brocadiaceae bacterium]|nr:hypothetical protein [Candidatus Brocadiaceae bacterium]